MNTFLHDIFDKVSVWSALSLLLCGLVLSACSGEAPEAIVDCTAAEGMIPVCGLQRPEDLESVGAGVLLVSQMGEFGNPDSSGSLLFLNSVTEETRMAKPTIRKQAGWGDPDCEALEEGRLSPHGIHLSTRANGRRQLLVVNHGMRESVEFYELSTRRRPVNSDPMRRMRLQWRGCVEGPENASLNDVAALPGGGFVVSHMNDQDVSEFGMMLKMLLRMDTGKVWQWRPEEGYQVVPGSQGTLPNGLQISADGERIFINLYGENLVRKLRLADGTVLGEAEVMHADNSSWSSQGRLLLASHKVPVRELSACFNVSEGACGLNFAIVSLAPDTMETETLFEHAGAPMGAATVAVEVQGNLWFGSFVGDRVAHIRMPGTAQRGTSDTQR